MRGQVQWPPKCALALLVVGVLVVIGFSKY